MLELFVIIMNSPITHTHTHPPPLYLRHLVSYVDIGISKKFLGTEKKRKEDRNIKVGDYYNKLRIKDLDI